MKKVVLGKGLDALIGKSLNSQLEDTMPLKMVPLHMISGSDYQPRKKFDQQALEELKQSVKEKGIIQPLLVKKVGEKYQLIAGERRLRVARDLGLERIPVIVKEVKGNEELLELALIENIQREDLNPIERAESYHRLIVEFGLKQDNVAAKVGKDRSSVANTLRLLNLEDEIKEMISSGLNFGQARALLAIDDPKERLKCARLAVSQSLNVRRLEALSGKRRFKGKEKQIAIADIHLKEAEAKLRESLQTRVAIKEGKGGKGRIQIEYFSNDERERILNRLLK